MKLIVGLGNPGKKYELSRHNLGFMVVDSLLQERGSEAGEWRKNKKANSLVIKVDDLVLAKPQTMMNASGFSVKRLVDFYKIKPEDVWVIHDDLDLPLGKVKIRTGGGSAGHRGLDSIVEKLETADFVRFRLGIGHPGPDSSDEEVKGYVLAPFDQGERDKAGQMAEKAKAIVEFSLKEGLEKAMNRFN